MTCTVCPNCGTALEPLNAYRIGRLFVDKGGAFIWWGPHVVPLTVSERLIVTTIARADGIPVRRDILADVTGYEGDEPENLAATYLCRINAKFHAIDPDFDQIENVWGVGLRWKTERGEP